MLFAVLEVIYGNHELARATRQLLPAKPQPDSLQTGGRDW